MPPPDPGKRSRARRLQVARVVRVGGSRGGEYEVAVLENGKVRCECRSFRYRRDCRHVHDPAVQDHVRALAPPRRQGHEVQAVALLLAAAIAPYCQRVEVVGSLRRQAADSKDIDLLFLPGAWSIEQVVALFRTFGRPVHQGETLGSIVLPQGIPAQLFCCESPAVWGAALLNWTGPTDYEISIRIRANHRGWKFSQHGLVDRATGALIAGATEEEVLEALDMPWLPPPLREQHRKNQVLDLGKGRRRRPPPGP